MKKTKLIILVCLIVFGLSIGAYTTFALTNLEVQNIITTSGSWGLTQSQTTSLTNTLQGMVTGSVVTGPANSVYSVTVDYSKTIDQLLTAVGIPFSGRDPEIQLGLFSNNTGTGQKNLDFLTIRTTDLFPGVDGLSTYNPVPISDIYSKMHEKGYRPTTLQEFLTVAAKYPQLLQNNNTYQAFGSLIKMSSLEKISVAGINGYYKYFVPYVFSGKVGLGAFGLSNTTADNIADYNSTIRLDFDKIDLEMSSPLARALWFVVRDPSAPISAPISLDVLPSTVAKGSNGYYLQLTGESYPVAVDYDKAHTEISARDMPLGAVRPNESVASPIVTGKANINIILGQVKGVAGPMQDNIMRDAIAVSSLFSGYRFATARELYAFNEQYTDKFVAGGGVVAFGSFNYTCEAYPILYMTNTHKDPIGTISGHGPTMYNDLRYIDLRKCVVPNEWAFDGKEHLMSTLPGYSACHTTNAYDVQTWKFALVKINP